MSLLRQWNWNASAPAVQNVVFSGEAFWLREMLVMESQHLGFAHSAINALWGISAGLMLTFLSVYCTTLNSALTASLADGKFESPLHAKLLHLWRVRFSI